MNQHKINSILLILLIFPQILKSETIDVKKIEIEMMEQAGVRTKESDLIEFIRKVKILEIDKNSRDDVVSLLGKPTTKVGFGSSEHLQYQFRPGGNNDLISATIRIGPTKFLEAVIVTKMTSSGSEDIFVKGNWDGGASPSKSEHVTETSTKNNTAAGVAPARPDEGEIYYNSSEKHFYGWNGTEWLQLDNPKANP